MTSFIDEIKDVDLVFPSFQYFIRRLSDLTKQLARMHHPAHPLHDLFRDTHYLKQLEHTYGLWLGQENESAQLAFFTNNLPRAKSVLQYGERDFAQDASRIGLFCLLAVFLAKNEKFILRGKMYSYVKGIPVFAERALLAEQGANSIVKLQNCLLDAAEAFTSLQQAWFVKKVAPVEKKSRQNKTSTLTLLQALASSKEDVPVSGVQSWVTQIQVIPRKIAPISMDDNAVDPLRFVRGPMGW